MYSDVICLERGFAGGVSLSRFYKCGVCLQGMTSPCQASFVSVLYLSVPGFCAPCCAWIVVICHRLSNPIGFHRTVWELDFVKLLFLHSSDAFDFSSII